MEDRATTHYGPFSQPHVALEDFTTDLTKAVKRVLPTSSRGYTSVNVLLLRWEDDDLGTEEEIQALDKLFRETYNYDTKRKTIPSNNPRPALRRIIVDFHEKHDSKTGLLIVYYGGHGIKRSNNQSMWAAYVSTFSSYMLAFVYGIELNTYRKLYEMAKQRKLDLASLLAYSTYFRSLMM